MKRLRIWMIDKSALIGALVVGAVVAYIEVGRQLGIAVPIPFLGLLGVLVLVASIGGKRAGIAGALAASLYIFYSMLINFGPETLTGGPVQVVLGILLMLVVGYCLGRIRDENHYLIRELGKTKIDLEQGVVARTAELSASNERLRHEISERMQAEETLRSKEIYYRLLIENALDIVTVMNADGTIRYESPSIRRVLGYEPEELVGQNAFDFIHSDDVDYVRKGFNEELGLSPMRNLIEFRFRHKDGSWRILEAIGNNLLSEPTVTGAIINSRDITRRREMEKRVQRQEQLAIVGQMAAGIAHDFNNAMAVVVLYAQILGMSSNLSAKEKRQVNIILEEGKRAAELTSQILDFGRQTVLDRRSLELIPFLQEFVNLLGRTLADNIKVVFDHKDESLFVLADANRLQQALVNLALNSRDAMPDGGSIKVEVAQIEYQPLEPEPVPEVAAGGWIQIVVADNGSGISAEVQNHLFEPFYTTKEPGKGTGLGLAQVYGIVKQHNGFIGVESEPGVGTTFTITLPAVFDGRPNEDRPAPEAIIQGNQELILIVEDNYATRIALMSALESLNYIVKGAKDGIEALILIDRHQEEIKLVMSDVVMPEMGGIDLVETMKAREIDIPVVLLTGNALTEEMALVKGEGLVEWYQKPIPLEDLAQVVASKLSDKSQASFPRSEA